MPFSAGTVVGQHLQAVAHVGKGSFQTAPTRPQAGFFARLATVFRPGTDLRLNDAEILVKNPSENIGNPYGIPGSQGPAINIGRVARAVRGREIPAIVTIDRRVDPQYSNRDGGRSVHGRQEQVPGKDQPVGTLEYNQFSDRPGIIDPEWLVRHGYGASRLAGGQTTGTGMQDTTRSSQLLNEGPAPSRIPRFWNDGLNAAAGLNQYAFTQQNYRVFLKHPWLGRVPQPTRGIRAVSGVGNQFSTSSTIRIPAVFVPSAVG
jgi:hypothetical protein